MEFTLDHDSGDLFYITDSDGIIVFVNNPEWSRFATDNGAPSLADPNNVIGKSLFDFIGGETQTAYRKFHHMVVRGQRSCISFTFNCDGPYIQRQMRMTITAFEIAPTSGGSHTVVMYHSSLLKGSPIEAKFHTRGPEAEGPLITVCSYCKKVNYPVAPSSIDDWVSAEVYYTRGGKDEVRVSHGICKLCFDSIYAFINQHSDVIVSEDTTNNKFSAVVRRPTTTSRRGSLTGVIDGVPVTINIPSLLNSSGDNIINTTSDTSINNLPIDLTCIPEESTESTTDKPPSSIHHALQQPSPPISNPKPKSPLMTSAFTVTRPTLSMSVFDEKKPPPTGMQTQERITMRQTLPAKAFSAGSLNNNPHIMVVEDDLMQQKLMKRLLERAKCTCDIASCSADVLNLLSININKYKLIFMDYFLNDETGAQITQHIRKLGVTSLIVGLTGSRDERLRDHCIQSGMDDVVYKPLSERNLIHILEHHSIIL